MEAYTACLNSPQLLSLILENKPKHDSVEGVFLCYCM